MNNSEAKLNDAAKLILSSSRTVAFTGAGISVESGIPPFRGENGLWNKYNPDFLDIGRFNNHPEESWRLIKEIFLEGRASVIVRKLAESVMKN
jgi:NAD-dependent deacetylase